MTLILENEGRLTGFPPIVGEAPRVLMLGSMPSERSLTESQYYAHPRNRFWPLMAALLAGKPGRLPYDESVSLLKSRGIALWDSIGSCVRRGSLDTSIRRELPNPIDWLVALHVGIRFILFNGRKAESAFVRSFRGCGAFEGISFRLLPSTSPANASWRTEDLARAWSEALKEAGIQLSAAIGSGENSNRK